MVKPLLIIKCGEKIPSLSEVPGDFENWILNGMQWSGNAMTCSVCKDEPLPDIKNISAVVITGSSAMVTDDLVWIHSTIHWLHVAIKTSTPILGICFGHQLIAKTLGGKVNDNPKGVEVGTVSMRMFDARDRLFSNFPASLSVQVSHQQAVLNLPEGAVRLASTDMDANHAFRYGDSVWGIQFHPEFDKPIVEEYIKFYKSEAGEDLVDNPSVDATESVRVLEQFAKLIKQ